MPTSNSGTSPEEILQRLSEMAAAHWGEERAQEIWETLENASRQLSEVSGNLPDKETEPGFYQ
jgi:putative heme iron utilization protein